MRFLSLTTATVAASLALGLAAGGTASAAPRHHGVRAGSHHVTSHHVTSHHAQPGVRFAGRPTRGGTALVSDGPGTGYGFHRLPGQFRVGALIHRDRQSAALHEAVDTDALTSGSYRGGFLGDDVAGGGPNAHYGVFSGADGYGSPYFAGYYGPGGGEDLGPLGHTYE